jgi:FkbM family methyltransferase
MTIPLSKKIIKTIVLSLSIDTERRHYIRKHFLENGIDNFEFFDAVDKNDSQVLEAYSKGIVRSYPTCFRCNKENCKCANNIIIPQQVGNWLSFVGIWKKLQTEDGLFLICEDDVAFHKNAITLLNQSLKHFSSNDKVLLRLVSSGTDPFLTLDKRLPLKLTDQVVMSNAAYIVSGEMVRHILSKFEKIEHTSDVWLHSLIATDPEVTCLSVFPLLGTDLSYNKEFAKFSSQIHPKGINEVDLIKKNNHKKRVDSEVEYQSLLREWLTASPLEVNTDRKRKIFQIGFNKTGTTSLHSFFESNGIKSVHWDERRLAQKIDANHNNKMSLISGYEEFDSFSDIEIVAQGDIRYVAQDLFKELHKEFPDAVFILNTRNVEHWIQSRLSHVNKINYPEVCMEHYKLTRDELINKWNDDYTNHINDVTAYFKKQYAPAFIHYKIDEDTPHKLADFLISKGFDIKNKLVPHAHKTLSKLPVDSKKLEKQKIINLLRYTAVKLEDIDTSISVTLMEKASELGLSGEYNKNKLQEYRDKLGLTLDNQDPFVKFHTPEGYRKCPQNSLFNFYGRNKEDFLVYQRYVKGKVISPTYFEVGGLDGIWASNTKFFNESLNWKGTLVEANPFSFKALIENRPQDICINCIISDQQEELPFTYYNDSPVSGVEKTLHKRVRKFHNENFVTEEFKTRTLDDIIKKSKIKEIGFFSLDVEGHELNVLNSYSFDIEIAVFLIEMGDEDIKIQNVMCSNGYIRHEDIGPNMVYLSEKYITVNSL